MERDGGGGGRRRMREGREGVEAQTKKCTKKQTIVCVGVGPGPLLPVLRGLTQTSLLCLHNTYIHTYTNPSTMST